MDHVDDITPDGLRFAWIPNDTIDHLHENNMLALSVLTIFVRHAAEYGMTLTKLLAKAGPDGPRKTQVSNAYNTLIRERYVARVEFTYARPAGDTGKSGKRYTVTVVSRVPISDETLASVVSKYTPGKHVLVRWGAPPPPGEDWEKRRVKVLAAEIYCHTGPMRIDRDGRLIEHTNARGRSQQDTSASPDKSRRRALDPRTRKPSAVDASDGQLGFELGPDRVDSLVVPEVSFSTFGTTCANTDNSLVTPEVEKLTSGVTSANRVFAQVLPEVGFSTSIKKTNKTEDEPEDHAGGAAGRSFGPPGSNSSGSPESVVRLGLALGGDQQTARARFIRHGGQVVVGSLDMLRTRTRAELLKAREHAGAAAVDALAEDPALDEHGLARVILRSKPNLTQGQLADRAARLLAWEHVAANEAAKTGPEIDATPAAQEAV